MNEVNPTDDSILNRMRELVSSHGKKFASRYEIFAAQTPEFAPYWQEGVDVIGSNSVERLLFGERVLLKVGREFINTPTSPQDILMELALELDREASGSV